MLFDVRSGNALRLHFVYLRSIAGDRDNAHCGACAALIYDLIIISGRAKLTFDLPVAKNNRARIILAHRMYLV